MIPDKSYAHLLDRLGDWFDDLMRHDSDLDAEERAEPIELSDYRRKREEDRRP